MPRSCYASPKCPLSESLLSADLLTMKVPTQIREYASRHCGWLIGTQAFGWLTQLGPPD